MINPLDRTTKKISNIDTNLFDMYPEIHRDTMYGEGSYSSPIAPNKKQLRERIRQHMKKEPSFTMVP